MAVTKTEVKAAMDTIRAVADAIRELGTVPSGHLYAQLAPCMTLATYERIVGMLTTGGLVRESGHVLTWAA